MTEPYFQSDLATIYNGNALEILQELPDESVQMCMSSPPYWGLRNYVGGSDIVWGDDEKCEHKWSRRDTLLHNGRGDAQKSGKYSTQEPIPDMPHSDSTCSLCGAWRGQLGLEPTPELYVAHLMMIFSEVKRVLRKDGSFYLNIGDTYASGKGTCYNPGGNSNSLEATKKEAGAYPLNRGNKSTLALSGLQPKCMTLIPERVMFAMIDDGWILRNKIVWHKPNSMPSSVKDRFTATWEYVYFFTKAGRYYFDLDAVREPHKTQSKVNNPHRVRLEQAKNDDLFGHGPNPQSFNLRVRDVKRGKGGSSAQSGELKASEKEVEEYSYPEKYHGSSHNGRAGMDNLTKHDQAVGRTGDVSYTDPLHTRDYSPKGKNPGDYWDITTRGFKGTHFAVYPEALCERPIKASSRVGDTILDPFAGSGTTGVVAKRLGRRAILIDCVEPYCAIAKGRITAVEYQPKLEVC